MGEMEAGFAKLQGEDFEYYMQTYSIVLGRNSKKSSVDVDLAGLGGGMNISRQHARILYDFERRRFVLEVLGKNGCYVEGVLHMPGTSPVKLDSQDLLQIGEKRFYFLLPAKKIARSVAAVSSPNNPRKRAAGGAPGRAGPGASLVLAPGPTPAKKVRGQGKNGPAPGGGVGVGGGGGVVRERKQASTSPWMAQQEVEPSPNAGSTTRVRDGYRYEDDEADEQYEEREVVRIILEKLQSQYHPGEWMAVSKLHADILDHFQSRNMSPQFMHIMGVDEDGNEIDGKGNGRAWSGLVNLLKRYPRHFVINTKLKGGIRVEYVSLYPEEQ
ncbi:hypothetical protein KC19_3G151900 [Ceratodon purpureus]|uniref:FHA domain-containing protein n=1 Tax=Ceratodon purpureus TaxID=3225 RepID=A0A8T0IL31_CERPU|nr:hypothetical protein KC19_3G151900 [Ceratodon purpureus]